MRRGLTASRDAARALVAEGRVRVGGAVADKPGRMVSGAEALDVDGEHVTRFVSRGGTKLEAALAHFGVDVAGRRCLDAGASTGGFTDCLLRRGAASVVCVDVGYGQLAPVLRTDPRIVVLERTNVRHLHAPRAASEGGGGDPTTVAAGSFEVVVADLSFISLTVVAPVLAGPLAVTGADLVVLVKPQFEAGRAEASRGRGVIRDPAVRRDALLRVASAFVSQRATIMGVMASPILGPAGNAEFFLHARTGRPTGPEASRAWGLPDTPSLTAAVDEALQHAPDRAPEE